MERKNRKSGNSKFGSSRDDRKSSYEQRSDRPTQSRRDDERAGKSFNSNRGSNPRSGNDRRSEHGDERRGNQRFDRDNRSERDSRGGFRNRDDRSDSRSTNRSFSPYSRERSNERFNRNDDGSRAPRKLQLEKAKTVNSSGEVRLNRFLANAGLCSRREADTLIQTGLVQINGQIVTELGVKVKPGDEVKFNNSIVRRERKVYILLNKPKDYITSADDPEKRHTVFELIKDACPERVFPVGRLDRNTTGVLLFTNDGDLADMLMHPKYSKKKIYHVFLDKKLRPDDYGTIAAGVELEDGFVKPDAVEYVSAEDHSQVGIEIHSGKNRIVRRIFEHLGYRVDKLDRVYFAGLTKKNLPRGRWRFLTDYEVSMLKKGNFN